MVYKYIFKLSEIDLEIRGEGKVTGKNQSGRSDLKIADLRYDYELLLESKSIYENIKGTDDSIEIFQEAKLLFPNYFAAGRGSLPCACPRSQELS